MLSTLVLTGAPFLSMIALSVGLAGDATAMPKFAG
jgi:hypothetical protein